jgi:ParB family chromosome partitioning protein
MSFQGDSIYWVEVEKVVPNPFQPRREFDQDKLTELGESIRMYGVLQPLTVTRNEVQRDDGTFYTEYELIAGERRLRASKLAGIAQVPVIIREGEQNEQEKLELAIIENLQREDLNAVDRAIAFKQLSEMFKLSHSQVAKKMGRSREYVSNSIRLLGLPEHMLDSLKLGDMMEGHARTLLMLTDRPEEQEVVYKEVLLKKLSVREVERIVRKIATDKVRKRNDKDLDANLIELEKQFTESLGTRVQIQKTDFGGKLTIDYFSETDLSIILKKIKDEEGNGLISHKEEVEKISEHTVLEVIEPANPVSVEVSRLSRLNNENILGPEIANEEMPRVDTESHDAIPQFDTTQQYQEKPPVEEYKNIFHPTVESEVARPENKPNESYFSTPTPTPTPVNDFVAPTHQNETASQEPRTELPRETSFLRRVPNQFTSPINNQPAVSEQAPVDEFEPVQQAQEKNDDDSDLYSINSFTV